MKNFKYLTFVIQIMLITLVFCNFFYKYNLVASSLHDRETVLDLKINNYENLELNKSKLNEALDYENKIINNSELPLMLTQIIELAKNYDFFEPTAKILDTSNKSTKNMSETTETKEISSVLIEFQCVGDVQKIYEFLEKLLTEKYIYSIDNLQITSKEGNSKILNIQFRILSIKSP